MAEITVLLPVYNGAGFLDETLQSLRQQSFPCTTETKAIRTLPK